MFAGSIPLRDGPFRASSGRAVEWGSRGAVRITRGLSLQSLVGGYRLLRYLGAGGMGVVFAAAQESPGRCAQTRGDHRGEVALKLIATELPTRSELERFVGEAESLQRLDHHAIAKVYSTGIERCTNDGRTTETPFLAMELVRGAFDVITFCEHYLLSMSDRLALMITVCDAIAHAHARGVIHRDLKAENVLIDQNGRPKIIDFGVAYQMNREADPSRRPHAARLTRYGHWVGTLAAMSPEQLEANPHRIDARCDIYALGVLLYRLVTGREAHDFSRVSSAAAAARIRRTRPVRPRRLNPCVSHELESVILHAIEHDPIRRYATAAELRDDLSLVRSGQSPKTAPRNRRHRISEWWDGACLFASGRVSWN